MPSVVKPDCSWIDVQFLPFLASIEIDRVHEAVGLASDQWISVAVRLDLRRAVAASNLGDCLDVGGGDEVTTLSSWQWPLARP